MGKNWNSYYFIIKGSNLPMTKSKLKTKTKSDLKQEPSNRSKLTADGLGPDNDASLDHITYAAQSGSALLLQNSVMKQQVIQPLVEFQIREHEIVKNKDYVVSIILNLDTDHPESN
jgi:hypothetical protein